MPSRLFAMHLISGAVECDLILYQIKQN